MEGDQVMNRISALFSDTSGETRKIDLEGNLPALGKTSEIWTVGNKLFLSHSVT